ncbi:hypothetical protein [Synechocystis sp. PCC 6714]|nr:hypothetical protein [Synechocystis sp. PCC 6714]
MQKVLALTPFPKVAQNQGPTHWRSPLLAIGETVFSTPEEG